MKIISRYRPSNWPFRFGQPRFGPWKNWEVCEGSENLTEAECRILLDSWAPDRPWKQDKPDYIWTELSRLMGCEEFRIVADSFNVESYNLALAE